MELILENDASPPARSRNTSLGSFDSTSSTGGPVIENLGYFKRKPRSFLHERRRKASVDTGQKTDPVG
ncbi:hypothetical protein RRG08_006553 [Elysia crispata]|uniref:Uncharacterized protein n=1 Tax=Elysia crispata TaxID=231223 RepID=A0AAE1A6I5_9GAST|nr:hypothetical protein RRG08_006553 [Elysia crispata]